MRLAKDEDFALSLGEAGIQGNPLAGDPIGGMGSKSRLSDLVASEKLSWVGA